MENAISNIEINKIYERYFYNKNNNSNNSDNNNNNINNNITKIKADSNYNERLTWIFAKYSARLYTIPNNNNNNTNNSINSNNNSINNNNNNNNNKISNTPTVLPSRIVDFFLTIGLSKFIVVVLFIIIIIIIIFLMFLLIF